MSLPSHLPKLLMLATAGLQGLGMYLLYRSFDEGLWQSVSYVVLPHDQSGAALANRVFVNG